MLNIIRDISLTHDWDLSSVVEAGDKGAADVHWIRRFAEENGDAIITGDSDFIRKHQQVIAVFETGVRVIYLPARWSNAIIDHKIAHLLQWWNRIETRLASMKPRECYEVTWNLQVDADLRKIDIDFHTAFRKLKKAGRKDTGTH